jgi:chromosome transmission fidelity protein 1
MLNFADQSHARIQDIEELVELGIKYQTCPYYGTRTSVADADVLCVPYNLLFQQNARTSSGIELKDNIIILDEAHNVIDAINSMHSVLVQGLELKATLYQLEKYYDRYKTRLSGKNGLYIKQIRFVCEQMLKMNGLSENRTDSILLTVPDYTEQLEIEHINLFKLLRFLEDSKLANKLHGFSERSQTKLQFGGKGEEIYLSTHHSPLRVVHELISSLVNPDEDGRIILSKTEQTTSIKYLLLNPSNVFRQVVEEARSVIFAGGTMEPMNDFVQQLFPHVSHERILKYSCGHVIPKEQLTTISLAKGPSGKEFEFTFENRNNPDLVEHIYLDQRSRLRNRKSCQCNSERSSSVFSVLSVSRYRNDDMERVRHSRQN